MADLSDDQKRDQYRRARHELGMTQVQLGAALRRSARTLSRLEGPNGVPDDYDFTSIARLMFAENPERAAQLARFGHTTLEAMGLVAPVEAPPPPAPTPTPTVAPRLLADTVACAAAEAANATPRAMRAGLLAALIRMEEVGLTAEELRKVLETPPTP